MIYFKTGFMIQVLYSPIFRSVDVSRLLKSSIGAIQVSLLLQSDRLLYYSFLDGIPGDR